MFVLFVTTIALSYLILIYIKKNYPQVWAELSSLHPASREIHKGAKATRLLWQNKHKPLNDSGLNRLVLLQKMLLSASAVFFIVLVTGLI